MGAQIKVCRRKCLPLPSKCWRRKKTQRSRSHNVVPDQDAGQRSEVVGSVTPPSSPSSPPPLMPLVFYQVQLSAEDVPPPLPPKRSPRQSPAVNSRLSHSGSSQRVPDLEAYHSCADDNSIRSLQARPLPDAPVRNSGSFADQFHSVASTLDRTLVDSQQNRVRPGGDGEEEEATLAESIVDSMHSCADTFQTGDDATLHSCADTIEGDDDMNSLRDFDSPTPPASVGSNSISSRLRSETQELGRELTEHVRNLRGTLDKLNQNKSNNNSID